MNRLRKINFSILSIVILHLPIFVCQFSFAQTDYTKFVNPMIGTGGHGHTFPGATVPFGMVQLSPDTRIDGSWDGCSGYHYSDNKIYGFSHTHLSGTGCSDYGDIMLMPSVKKPEIQKEKYASTFKHENEKAEAGYYSVELDDKIKAEFTTSTRAGFHHYTFPTSKEGHILLDLTHRDKTTESYMRRVGNNAIEGMRVSEAWAKKQYIYFYAEFDSNFSLEVYQDDELLSYEFFVENYYSGENVKAILTFDTKKKKDVFAKVGISQVSVDGARKNLEAEIPHWDFEKTKQEAKEYWNKELSKIDVTKPETTNPKPETINQLTIFYTALYHCMIHPSVASDVDGKYLGRDFKIHEAEDFTYYTVFSLWDTFRALHPLFTIIDQKRTNDFIKTFLAQYEQGGRLPVWELSSNETDCMIGYHSVSVIADAYAKGISNYNEAVALRAMIESAENKNYRGIGKFMENGFLGIEDESESVSKNLEYAYDDWCIAQLSKIFPHESFKTLTNEFTIRSLSWRNLFDSQTNFIRPRSNGGWLEPFDPREVNNNYTEANAWQYTFYVPHDVNSMIDLMGGNEKFEAKLDELFTTSTQTTGRTQADITGLIGQYAHGNEPSHHMAYLYAYVGKPQKTQKILHQIKTEFYKNSPDGLIGNEDCGQMSAWYVFSSLGFYPVCPGDPKYVIGSPGFEKAIIHLENGKDFTIEAKNISDANFYLDNHADFVLEHSKIMEGGNLKFEMKAEPDNIKKSVDYTFPQNKVVSPDFIPVPVIISSGKTFKDSMLISIEKNIPHAAIYYSFNPPCYLDTCLYKIYEYKKPFYINKSCSIWAWEYDLKSASSKQVKSDFHKIENNYTIDIKSKYNPQYTAGGDEGIIDGLYGDTDWRKGGWQGYQAQDFECIIDMKEEKSIKKIELSFLEDTKAWIFFPTEISIYYCTNGIDFIRIPTTMKIEESGQSSAPTGFKKSISDFRPDINARYIKIIAKNYGKLPDWHPGHGMKDDNAFIFIDEITIE